MHRVISLFPDIVDNERYTVEFEKKENDLEQMSSDIRQPPYPVYRHLKIAGKRKTL